MFNMDNDNSETEISNVPYKLKTSLSESSFNKITDGLLKLIVQFLACNNFTKTLKTFQEECDEIGLKYFTRAYSAPIIGRAKQLNPYIFPLKLIERKSYESLNTQIQEESVNVVEINQKQPNDNQSRESIPEIIVKEIASVEHNIKEKECLVKEVRSKEYITVETTYRDPENKDDAFVEVTKLVTKEKEVTKSEVWYADSVSTGFGTNLSDITEEIPGTASTDIQLLEDSSSLRQVEEASTRVASDGSDSRINDWDKESIGEVKSLPETDVNNSGKVVTEKAVKNIVQTFANVGNQFGSKLFLSDNNAHEQTDDTRSFISDTGSLYKESNTDEPPISADEMNIVAYTGNPELEVESQNGDVQAMQEFTEVPKKQIVEIEGNYTVLKTKFSKLQGEHQKLMALASELTSALQTNVMGKPVNFKSLLKNCRNIYPELFTVHKTPSSLPCKCTRNKPMIVSSTSNVNNKSVKSTYTIVSPHVTNMKKDGLKSEQSSQKTGIPTVKRTPKDSNLRNYQSKSVRPGAQDLGKTRGSTSAPMQKYTKNNTINNKGVKINRNNKSNKNSDTSDEVISESVQYVAEDGVHAQNFDKNMHKRLSIGSFDDDDDSFLEDIHRNRLENNKYNNKDEKRNRVDGPRTESTALNECEPSITIAVTKTTTGTVPNVNITARLSHPEVFIYQNDEFEVCTRISKSGAKILRNDFQTDADYFRNAGSTRRNHSSNTNNTNNADTKHESFQIIDSTVEPQSHHQRDYSVASLSLSVDLDLDDDETIKVINENNGLHESNFKIVPNNVSTNNQFKEDKNVHNEQYFEDDSVNLSGNFNIDSLLNLSKYFELDFEAIRHDLITGTVSTKFRLLDALRWRITRSIDEVKYLTIKAYCNNDLLGINYSFADMDSPKRLFLKDLYCPDNVNTPHPIQQSISKLVNAIASLKLGRDYLTTKSILLKNILLPIVLKKVKNNYVFDLITEDMIIATLQKLSLRYEQRIVMIQSGLVEHIISYLSMYHTTLSPYCLEYSTALLMNLCLHKEAKQRCESKSRETMQLLMYLLNPAYRQCLPYINGTMYSMLSSKILRQEAKRIDLEKLLEFHMKMTEGEMRKQLEFLIRVLRDPRHFGQECDCEPNDVPEDEVDLIEIELEGIGDSLFEPSTTLLMGEELLYYQYRLKNRWYKTQNVSSIPIKTPHQNQKCDKQHIDYTLKDQFQRSDTQDTEESFCETTKQFYKKPSIRGIFDKRPDTIRHMIIPHPNRVYGSNSPLLDEKDSRHRRDWRSPTPKRERSNSNNAFSPNRMPDEVPLQGCTQCHAQCHCLSNHYSTIVQVPTVNYVKCEYTMNNNNRDAFLPKIEVNQNSDTPKSTKSIKSTRSRSTSRINSGSDSGKLSARETNRSGKSTPKIDNTNKRKASIERKRKTSGKVSKDFVILENQESMIGPELNFTPEMLKERLSSAIFSDKSETKDSGFDIANQDLESENSYDKAFKSRPKLPRTPP